MTTDKTSSCEFASEQLLLRFKTTLPGDVEVISPVVEGVMQIVRQMNCAPGKEFEVETAIREALANAMVHGCREDRDKKIQFCVSCDETRGLLIVVRDPGPGFDPANLPSPLVGEQIYSNHGRGIFLINQLMDEVHFERGGTEIHMVKR